MKTIAIVMIFAALASVAVAQNAAADKRAPAANPYGGWQRGLTKDASYFPIAVWLQGPNDAAKYKAAGINLYVGLWKGPTAEQLDQLRKAGMPVICAQNEYALTQLDNPIIVGWMHGDEPDNAQSIARWASADQIRQAWPNLPARHANKTLEQWGKYGPPFPPAKIIEDYLHIKQNDPSRPIMLNLGQGVAWEGYGGRGVRSGRLEDYPLYAQGSDIVSFDIYPAVHSKKEIAGNLWYVPRGVERLVTWTEGKKIVWNCIEAARISNPNVVPTGHQIRSEVWMSIIHGSKGLIYFVHQFKPTSNENSLLDDPKLLAEVTAINKQVHALAPVINSPTLTDVATVATANEAVPVQIMTKRLAGDIYIFAAAMRDGKTAATITIAGLAAGTTIEVIGENRTLTAADGSFADAFGGYDVHLYKIDK